MYYFICVYVVASDLLSTVARLSQGLIPMIKEERVTDSPRAKDDRNTEGRDNMFGERAPVKHEKTLPINPFDRTAQLEAPAQMQGEGRRTDGTEATVEGKSIVYTPCANRQRARTEQATDFFPQSWTHGIKVSRAFTLYLKIGNEILRKWLDECVIASLLIWELSSTQNEIYARRQLCRRTTK